MPFLLLVGAAPNAIAYDSYQFTSGEYFTAGLPASLQLLMDFSDGKRRTMKFVASLGVPSS